MDGTLILITFIAIMMFVCAVVSKFIFDTRASAENKRNKKNIKRETENLKDRYK